MGFSLRTIDPQSKFSSQITMQAIEKVIPQATVEAVLTEQQAWHERERKLSMPAVVLALIMMSLYRHLAIGHVIKKMAQGLRFLWPDPTDPVPGASTTSAVILWPAGCRLIVVRLLTLGLTQLKLANAFQKPKRPFCTNRAVSNIAVLNL